MQVSETVKHNITGNWRILLRKLYNSLTNSILFAEKGTETGVQINCRIQDQFLFILSGASYSFKSVKTICIDTCSFCESSFC